MGSVPAEFRGKARRLFHSAAASNLDPHLDRQMAMIDAAQARLATGRCIRRETISALTQAWVGNDAPGRLSVHTERHHSRTTLTEIRLSRGWRHADDWVDVGEHGEPFLEAVFRRLIVGPKRFVYDGLIGVTFSLHAVARRFQRGFGGVSDEAVLDDVRALIRASGGLLEAGVGMLRVDARSGGTWCCEIANVTNGSLTNPAVVVRTFV